MNALGKIIRKVYGPLIFTILDIGALPIEGANVPFYQLLDVFPGSKIIAFELGENVCDALNKEARTGLTYYPVALGRNEEERILYETSHPMCCSLYKPDDDLLSRFNNLDVALLKSIHSIETVGLDHFAKSKGFDTIDFIKIDIQGAELDVFRGGIDTLRGVVALISEVEFIPLYVDQPLFGDVCKFLASQGFMFHKFFDIAGRSLKPIIVNGNPDFPAQHMWADALFMKDIRGLSELSSDKLLKIGVLSYLYQSPDVAFHCFHLFDQINQTNIHQEFIEGLL